MFYNTFAEYHLKRTERKEKIKLCMWGIGFAVLGLCLVLLCAFIATI